MSVKNCNSCKNIDMHEGESEHGDKKYFICDKRQDKMKQTEEMKFLIRLQNPTYRVKFKRCFEAVSKLGKG